MQIHANGKYGKSLKLGVQTNIGDVQKRAICVATAWAPNGSKSFTIESLRHTDYHGATQLQETGYATIVVSYYSTRKEGKIIIDKKLKIA